MKTKTTLKAIVLLFTVILIAKSSSAQLPEGSTAPNFTAYDLNGNSHTLYDYLDQGKVVFLDISATWCGPCWTYHNTGNFKNLYNQYGPDGTDEVMVFFIEGDQSTTLDDLKGTGTNTQGNYVDGTPYPIIDEASIATDFEISFYPTIYMVCPNRSITVIGQQSTADLYAAASNSCPSPASQDNDPTILGYSGETTTCSDIELKVKLQNNGLQDLTSATIEAKDGATTLASTNWTGSLSTYYIEEVSLGTVSLSSTTNITFEITSTDDNSSNNSATETIVKATESVNEVTLSLLLDNYCTETTWDIKDAAGSTIASGGPYHCESNGGGAEANTTITENFTLTNDCFKFTIYDSYGDGLNSGAFGGTDGNYSIIDAEGTLLASGGGDKQFKEDSTPFEVSKTTSMKDGITAENSFDVYPNPFKSNTNISISIVQSCEVALTVYNILGEAIYTEDKGNLRIGSYTFTLEGSGLSEGIYYLNLSLDDKVLSKKIILSK